jgi:hypothetical protein
LRQTGRNFISNIETAIFQLQITASSDWQFCVFRCVRKILVPADRFGSGICVIWYVTPRMGGHALVC